MIWCVPKGGRRDEARLLKPLAAQLKASTNQIYASARDMRGVGGREERRLKVRRKLTRRAAATGYYQQQEQQQ